MKLHYDLHTGRPLGYYASDLSYRSIPTPHIEITDLEYQSMLGKEHEFRVQDKKLENISDTPEYLIEESDRLYIKALEKVNSGALEACKYGVITVEDSYNVNVNWKDYYQILKKVASEIDVLKVKVYDEFFKATYMDLESEEAKIILDKFISAIDMFVGEYVPKKQAEYLTALELINAEEVSLRPAKLRTFYDSVDYGIQISA